MLGCPGDIEDEVDIFFREVQRWNEQHGEEYGVMLLPKHWSTHAHPQLGERAQGIINTQLSDKADILIAIFWSRLGTETGIAPSGTAEEIMRFYESGRPVKLYFSENANLSPSKIADRKFVKEFERLSKFRKQSEELGLYDSFKDSSDFSKKLERHLMLEVRSLRDRGFVSRREQIASTSEAPDTAHASLRILKRTVERLRRDWKAEANSHASRYDQGRQIMARLSSALSTHLAELRGCQDAI